MRTLIQIILKTPALKPYKRDVINYLEYIRRTSEIKYLAHGEWYDETGFNEKDVIMEYAHRWTETYQKRVKAAFYQLEKWLEAEPHEITLLSITGFTGWYSWGEKTEHDVSIMQAFDNLKHGADKLLKILRKEIPDLEYILVWEPHKTGYPHAHCALITHEPIPEEIIEKVKTIWSEKYKLGSKENGLNFKIREPDEPIRSIRNYLLKYIIKTFHRPDSKYPISVRTPGQTVFNALAHKYHWRLIQKSSEVTRMMKYTPKIPDGCTAITWSDIELSRPEAGATPHSEKRIITPALSFMAAMKRYRATGELPKTRSELQEENDL